MLLYTVVIISVTYPIVTIKIAFYNNKLCECDNYEIKIIAFINITKICELFRTRLF